MSASKRQKPAAAESNGPELSGVSADFKLKSGLAQVRFGNHDDMA